MYLGRRRHPVGAPLRWICVAELWRGTERRRPRHTRSMSSKFVWYEAGCLAIRRETPAIGYTPPLTSPPRNIWGNETMCSPATTAQPGRRSPRLPRRAVGDVPWATGRGRGAVGEGPSRGASSDRGEDIDSAIGPDRGRGLSTATTLDMATTSPPAAMAARAGATPSVRCGVRAPTRYACRTEWRLAGSSPHLRRISTGRAERDGRDGRRGRRAHRQGGRHAMDR